MAEETPVPIPCKQQSAWTFAEKRNAPHLVCAHKEPSNLQAEDTSNAAEGIESDGKAVPSLSQLKSSTMV
jgi:hypothetical protein